MKNNILNKYAQDIVRITYNLERLCNAKEIIFCKDLEITPSEFRFLRYIKEYKEINAKNIANIMNSTAPRISKLLRDLQQKDYIIITKDIKDKRYSLISLSNKGEIFINGIMDKYIKFHKNILLSVNKEEDLSKMIKTLSDFEKTLSSFCFIQ